MKLVQIIYKFEVGKPDAVGHWNLALETYDDIKRYMEVFHSKQAGWLYDWLGDRDMKDKGNNPIGTLLTHKINATPEGQLIHVGHLASEVDVYQNQKLKGMMKLYEMGETIRVAAAGGYSTLNSFHIVKSINIDENIMRLYLFDKHDEYVSRKILTFYEFLINRTFQIENFTLKVRDVISMRTQNVPKKIIFNLECDVVTKDDESGIANLATKLNEKLERDAVTYFKMEKQIGITIPKIHRKSVFLD
jgi:hypothetical protein